MDAPIAHDAGKAMLRAWRRAAERWVLAYAPDGMPLLVVPAQRSPGVRALVRAHTAAGSIALRARWGFLLPKAARLEVRFAAPTPTALSFVFDVDKDTEALEAIREHGRLAVVPSVVWPAAVLSSPAILLDPLPVAGLGMALALGQLVA